MKSPSSKNFLKRIKFDAVLGNPPWISFSGKSSNRPSPKAMQLFADEFETFKGWPNSVSLFFELGSKILNRDGVMGFVAPLSISHQKTYGATREALNKTVSLLRLIELGEKQFSGVTEPCAIYLFRKKSGDSEREEEGAYFGEFEELPKNIVNITEWVNRRPVRQAEAILKKLLANSCGTLKGRFKDNGVHTGNSASELIFDSPPQDNAPHTLIYEGKNIKPFRLERPTKYLLTETKLAEGRYFRIGNREDYQKTGLLIRQTAQYPIAALLRPNYPYRNSALALREDAQSPFSLNFLCALLNSWLVRFYFQILFADVRQKTFPQIKIGHLDSAPLPSLPPDKKTEELIEIAIERLMTGKDYEEIIKPAEFFFNYAVFKLFDLTVLEVEFIIRTLEGIPSEEFLEFYKRERDFARFFKKAGIT